MQSHSNSELEYDYNMKHLVYTLLVFVLFSCDNEAGWGCIQTSGASVVDELTVEPFDKILVNRDIELVIRQGEAYNVEIQTGQNLRSGIEVSVVDDSKLVIKWNDTVIIGIGIDDDSGPRRACMLSLSNLDQFETKALSVAFEQRVSLLAHR